MGTLRMHRIHFIKFVSSKHRTVKVSAHKQVHLFVELKHYTQATVLYAKIPILIMNKYAASTRSKQKKNNIHIHA